MLQSRSKTFVDQLIYRIGHRLREKIFIPINGSPYIYFNMIDSVVSWIAVEVLALKNTKCASSTFLLFTLDIIDLLLQIHVVIQSQIHVERLLYTR